MAYWQEHSLGIAPQVSGFGTANVADADYKYILGDKPKVQFATELTELELMTGQIGAAPERLVGRRHGTISFSIPLEGFKSGYDPTAEDPGGAPVAGAEVVPAWLAILGNVLGSYITNTVDTAVKFWRGIGLSNSEYTAGGMTAAGSSASAIVFDGAAGSNKVSVGELVVAALSVTSTAPQFGFAKTKAVQTVTLFEAAANNVADNAGNIYGTSNAWLSPVHGSQLPMTMRWVGENVNACYYLKDCVCTGVKITWESGAVPTIEFSFNFYDFTVDKTEGGLQVPQVYNRIPQIVGTNNGRATLGRVKAGAFSVAASDALQCGLESCTWEYKVEISEIKCHSATQGITGVTYKKPRITVNASIPWVSTDEVRDSSGTAGNTGSHWWQSAFELGERLSLGVYVGSNVGKLFAFLVPYGRLVAVPQVADLGGSVGYQLTIEAGAYTGDTTDTAETTTTSPLDSIARVAVG